MSSHDVTVFKSYPFCPGQKIRIEESQRAGDWEVVKVTDRKITLRCPISDREFEWNKFCYFVEEQKNAPWPQSDKL